MNAVKTETKMAPRYHANAGICIGTHLMVPTLFHKPCSALRESPCLHPPHSQGTACQSCACGVVGARARPNHAMWETQVSGAQGAHMEVLLVDNLVARLREIIVCDWHTRRPVSGRCAKFGYQLLPPFVQNYCGQDSKAYVLALLGCNTHL